MSSSSTAVNSRPRRGRRKPLQEQRFAAYLTFGYSVTVCLGMFLTFYVLFLFTLSPLLSQEAPVERDLKRGEVLKPVVDPLVEKIKHIPHVPAQAIAEGVAGAVKKKFNKFRESQGMTDAMLIEKAAQDLENLRKRRFEADNVGANEVDLKKEAVAPVQPGKRTGFIVLGMHRSGTSMLSGLLALGSGYNVGGPLIGGAFDNVKGFFERVDAVLQNDEFMNLQDVWWSANVMNYDPKKALEDKKSGKATFENGEKALEFLNNPSNAPWLQKDPRICITLRTWLPLLNSEPAILFTYRHPLEVALSLKKREKNFSLEHGLRLWIVYNMRAIQNSAGLCRVLSSNEAILADPLKEVQRISDELTTKCGVPKPPRTLEEEDVNRFVDPTLQHNKKLREAEEAKDRKVLANFDGCIVNDYKSDTEPDSQLYETEHKFYLKAMKIYCDFKSGKAYEPGYQWPEFP